MFVAVIYFHPSLRFVCMAGAYPSEFHYIGWLLAMPTTIRLEWKCLTARNISLVFVGKAGTYTSGVHYTGGLLALPTNITFE